MNNESRQVVVYWDTLAVLSSLFSDDRSPQAQYWINQDGFHFLSTLTYAEICAVIARMQEERRVVGFESDRGSVFDSLHSDE